MSGKRLTLHYHEGTHRNIPVRRAGLTVGARHFADFAVLWGLMPDQLVLPRLDTEFATTEQRGAVEHRKKGRAQLSEALLIGHSGQSTGNIAHGWGALAAWNTSVISIILEELADNSKAGFKFQSGTSPNPDVAAFLTFSAPIYLAARHGSHYGFRDHARAPRGERDWLSAMAVFLGVVKWLYVSRRPNPVKESPVIAKTAEELDWETILHHGDRRLQRGLLNVTDCLRRIAVR